MEEMALIQVPFAIVAVSSKLLKKECKNKSCLKSRTAKCTSSFCFYTLFSKVPPLAATATIVISSYLFISFCIFLAFQNERDSHEHAIFDNLSLLNNDLLILDPRASNIGKGLIRTFDSFVDSVFKALFRR